MFRGGPALGPHRHQPGRIIALDTPGGLKSQVQDMNVVEVRCSLPEEMLRTACGPCLVDASPWDHEQADAYDPDRSRRRAVPDVLPLLAGLKVSAVRRPQPTLETPTCAWLEASRGLPPLIRYWRTVLVVARMNLRLA
jgi:hypothetical protein